MLPSSREPGDKTRTSAGQDQGSTVARKGGKDPRACGGEGWWERAQGEGHTSLKTSWRMEEEEGLPLEPQTFLLPLPPLDIWSVNVSVFGARGYHFSWKEKEVPTAAAAGTQLSSNELENSFPLILIILEAS